MSCRSDTLHRVARCRDIEGRTAWHGLFRLAPGCAFSRVVNDAGLPIRYSRPQYARAAAEFVGASFRLAGPPRAEV